MSQNIQPISLIRSLLVFAFSYVLVVIGVYVITPFLLEKGVPFFICYLVAFQTVPFIFLFMQLLVLYRREGNTFHFSQFTQRLRLTWSWKIGLQGLALFVFGVVTYMALQPLARLLAETALFAPPNWFPADLHPLKISQPGELMGFHMQGHWWAVAVYLLGWFFNIFGEELLFRGYLLPRQELRFGKRAWLVNGLMWNAWHLFWRWQIPALLPFHLALAFLVQKNKSTTIGIIAHGLLNFIAILMLIKLVIG